MRVCDCGVRKVIGKRPQEKTENQMRRWVSFREALEYGIYSKRRVNENNDSPTKIPGPEVLLPTGVSHALYLSKEAKRIAILGTMPVTTAPRPV